MSEFAGKIALVTGASRGIGRAVAERLAAGGAKVIVNYAANDEAARATAQTVGGELAKFDVADSAACAKAIEDIVARHGRIDILVNNAGIAIDALAVRVKDDDWRRQLAVNLDGAFFLCRAAARPMMKQKGGAIVNLTSVVGEAGNPGQAAYAASKAGLIGLTKSLAQELASRAIRVNAVSPGFIETDMTARLPEAARAKLLDAVPLGRLGSAGEVAEAVAFLCSDRASYITGAVLKVNGGMYL